MFVNIVLFLCIVFLVVSAMRYIIFPALYFCMLIVCAAVGGFVYGIVMLFKAIINLRETKHE